MRTLVELSRALSSGQTTSRELVEGALRCIDSDDGQGGHTFVRVFREAALASADASDALRNSGVVPSPIAGIPLSVKDLFDIAGYVTLSGSATRNADPPADCDATAVARLRAAGAVIIGTTNMTEFAMGGLGLNPHFGNCRNPWDRDTGRVPGGSSSGAAVSVSDSMAAAAIGSDSLGSVRIPAGLCGLVGFKPTASRVPLKGVFPLSTTLDSVGPIGRTVRCCAWIDSVLAGETPSMPPSIELSGLRIGVPKTLVLDDLEAPVGAAFERALATLSRAGAKIDHFEFAVLDEIAALNRQHGLTAVESYAVHRHWIRIRGGGYDPRVLARMTSTASSTAADYYDVLQRRRALITMADRMTAGFDAIAMPTLPIVAPPIEQFVGSAEREKDGLPILVRNTASANYLDRCALTVPCHEPGTAPVGLMLMGATDADRNLLGIGVAIEEAIDSSVRQRQ